MTSDKKRVIVTGGAGFIGSYITARLLAEGYKVTILDNLSTGKKENIPPSTDFIGIDLGEENAYAALEKLNCDAIFHLAGQSSGEASFKNPLYDLKSHITSTLLLLEWCKKKDVRRFLYAGSMATYGDPKYLPVDELHPQEAKTCYAAAKISAEAYIKLYRSLGLDTTIFRLFSVYGPGQNLDNKLQGMVSIYLSYMMQNKPILVRGSEKRFRDFIYIDDVVDAWMASFHNSMGYGKVYNLATGVKTTVGELIDAMREVFGDADYPVEYESPTPGDQFGVSADITAITRELKWKPKISLRAGLKKMVDFERSNATPIGFKG